MTQTSNRFFDEIGRLMNDAAGAAQGVKREVDTVVRNQAEKILSDLDIVKREEFEAVKDMARLAREENEALKARIAVLEAKLGLRPRRRTTAALKVAATAPRGVSSAGPASTPRGHEGDGRAGRRQRNWAEIPAFPCHFAPLGLEPRHVRSPRTPGGLLRRQTGRDAAFNFLENKDLHRWRPSRN